MGIIATVKRWIGMLFKRRAEDDFDVKAVKSPDMDKHLQICADIYNGRPYWVSKEDNVKTIDFAKTLCSETGRLTMLGTKITISGSARATWLQDELNKSYYRLRHWVEFGAAYGTIIIKPNGTGFDVFTPFEFMITNYDNNEIKGIIFQDKYQDGDWYYTRLEYHRFEDIRTDDGLHTPYFISNKAYRSKSQESLGDAIPLTSTKWAELLEETQGITKANGQRLDGPMFGVLRMPAANNIDMSSPLGIPIFQDAIEELKDLDVAYSRYVMEIFDSEKIVLADDQLMFGSGTPISERYAGMGNTKLPHYIKNVFGNGAESFYQEINPQLNTETRLTGINHLLSQIGYKIGFSNGYFVFNEKTGIQTATGVEAEQQRTIQYIKDIRDQLEKCLKSAIYAMSVYADLYGLAPAGNYEIVYDFGDITYNRETDKQTWWSYVMQNKVPAWMYFVKFEGFSEEEAKAMVEEAQPKEPSLFEEE